MKLLTTAILVGLAMPAFADGVTISTGREGLTYNNVYGVNLADALSEYGHQVSLAPSKGSLENLDRVAGNQAQIGFAQSDAFMFWKGKNGNLAQQIELSGELGEECVFVAVRKDGPIKSEDDIKAGVKIAVGETTSGSFASWSYLQTLNASYAKAETYAKGGLRSLAKLNTGEYDAFLWTAAINKSNEYLEVVTAKGSGLTILDLNDWDLNNKLPNGKTVYEFKKAVIDPGVISDTKVEVPCMKTLVITNAGSDEKLLDDVASTMLKNSARITGSKQ